MRKNVYIIAILVIVVLVGIFIFYQLNYSDIKVIEANSIVKTVDKEYYSVIYYGKRTDHISKNLKEIAKAKSINVYYSNASKKEINKLLKDTELSVEELPVYVFYVSGVPVYVAEGSRNIIELNNYIQKYFYGEIPESERKFIVPASADELIKKVNSKNYTVTVFGEQSCRYCTLYMPVFNKVADDFKLDIYYVDKSYMKSEEYNKILALDYDIPGKCTVDGIDSKLTKVFPRPFTMFTKGGKFIDCIPGYVTEDVLINYLKSYKLIEE